MQQRFLVMVDVLDTGTTNFNLVFASDAHDAERQALAGLPDNVGEVNVLTQPYSYTDVNLQNVSGMLDDAFTSRRKLREWNRIDLTRIRRAQRKEEAEGPARTVQQWAQLAYDIQNASNMGGIARSFRELVSFLHGVRGNDKGTDWVNTHPLVQLFADKIADLSRASYPDTMGRAYEQMEKLRKGEAIE